MRRWRHGRARHKDSPVRSPPKKNGRMRIKRPPIVLRSLTSWRGFPLRALTQCYPAGCAIAFRRPRLPSATCAVHRAPIRNAGGAVKRSVRPNNSIGSSAMTPSDLNLRSRTDLASAYRRKSFGRAWPEIRSSAYFRPEEVNRSAFKSRPSIDSSPPEL